MKSIDFIFGVVIVSFIFSACNVENKSIKELKAKYIYRQNGLLLFDGTVEADNDLLYFVPTLHQKLTDSNYIQLLIRADYFYAYAFLPGRIDIKNLYSTYGETYGMGSPKKEGTIYRKTKFLYIVPVTLTYSVDKNSYKDLTTQTDTTTFYYHDKPLQLISNTQFVLQDSAAIPNLSLSRKQVLEKAHQNALKR